VFFKDAMTKASSYRARSFRFGASWATAVALHGASKILRRPRRSAAVLSAPRGYGGASDALLESVSSPLPPSYAQIRERHVAAVKNSLCEPAFQIALSHGRALSMAQAIAYALEA
jgi:hypothetical protein